MKLKKLLKAVDVKNISGLLNKEGKALPDPDIGSIHFDSRDVKPCGLFVAVPGFTVDGNQFIDQAIENGAAAVVTQNKINKNTVIIQVENSRKALGQLAARFYGNPSESLVVIGITGTNGKTTTACIIEKILYAAGVNPGVIGTINCHFSGNTYKNPRTTPESLDLQRIMATMLKSGVTHVVMEVSSHALDLLRIECCRLDVGVFTNLTQDHMDFHKGMESYWECKKKMFTEHLCSGPKKNFAVAVINCLNKRGKELEGKLDINKISVGCLENSMVRPENISYSRSGITGKISTPKGSFEFKSRLAGKYNLENILCAAGTGIALDINLNAIKKGIEETRAVPGRLEQVEDKAGKTSGKQRTVYVDYAHTPDALENVLASIKSMTKGRVICVFGCGGCRDRDKRPLMGEIAGKLCDLAVITSDNPRTEPPDKIIEDIVAGIKRTSLSSYLISDLKKGMNGYTVEPDRRRAINKAIMAVTSIDDTVLIAGKGHETCQIIGKDFLEFDDRKEAEKALLQHGAIYAD